MKQLKFLIVPDSFKDCMPAIEVGKNIQKGVKSVFTNAEITIIPMADGGEGTVACVINALGGEIINLKVLDPIGRLTNGFIGLINQDKTAIIEMAAASGLEKLKVHERNPWITSSYGTGQLINAALDLGCTEIIVGIGGSATNDGGMGMAKALGVKFYDSNGYCLDEGGGCLNQLYTIDATKLDARIANTRIIAATDVVSPLIGKDGASLVFSAQKGATLEIAKQLDSNLTHFASIIKQSYSIDISNIAGGGAAGGLGAGLVTFLNAEIKSGFDTIAQLIKLEDKIQGCDIIITAEGKVDDQTLQGKLPIGLGKLAIKHNKPLFLFTGNATVNAFDLYAKGISSLIPITRKPTSLENAILDAPIWLEKSAEELCKILDVGAKM
jgi:glycerate kinase